MSIFSFLSCVFYCVLIFVVVCETIGVADPRSLSQIKKTDGEKDFIFNFLNMKVFDDDNQVEDRSGRNEKSMTQKVKEGNEWSDWLNWYQDQEEEEQNTGEGWAERQGGGGLGLTQQSVTAEFQEVLTGLPALLEAARLEIIHHTAANNMLGYTIAASFLVGAGLDTLAEILIQNKTHHEDGGDKDKERFYNRAEDEHERYFQAAEFEHEHQGHITNLKTNDPYFSEDHWEPYHNIDHKRGEPAHHINVHKMEPHHTGDPEHKIEGKHYEENALYDFYNTKNDDHYPSDDEDEKKTEEDKYHSARWVGRIGFYWFYAFGFGGPWYFPSTFSGGQAHLACSSTDFLALLAEHGLTLNIASFTSRPPGPRSVLLARLRRDFTTRLGCVVGKAGDYRGAAAVGAAWQQLLSLVELHEQLGPARSPGPSDLAALDEELQQLWTGLPDAVAAVHGEVVASRASTAAVTVFVGLLNVLGLIFHVVLQIASVKGGEAEAVGPGPVAEIPQQLGGGPVGGGDGEEDKHLKLGEALLIAAPFGWGYGYVMTYFLFLEPVNPGCGPLQLAAIQARYPGLGSVGDLLAGGATGLEVRYLVDSRRRELDLALHCLLTTQEGAKLANMLDMFDSLAHTRIDFST